MLLKDAGAAVVIDVVRQRVHDVVETQLDGHARRAALQRELEHLRTIYTQTCKKFHGKMYP